jgi:serine/threonine protein kinase/Flp pilus assembly protein TadD
VTRSASTSGPDLFNLLADEFAERYRRGERPPLSEYTDRYPELADEIRELFPAMVAIEQFGSGADAATGPHSTRPKDMRPMPERLGDYRIVREIARGGMGIVYEAVQESLGRHVALKVLPHHRLSDPSQLERFRREARAAATLHHTNIVPVFGVGECDGVHHYAMQYIQGQSLDDVLREVTRLRGVKPTEPAPSDVLAHDPALAKSVALGLVSGQFASRAGVLVEVESTRTTHLPPPGEHPTSIASGEGPGPSHSASSIVGQSGSLYFRSVARIGIQVAEAIAYAHDHKVLHRDIKPSNLLLDLQGTVWVTDFGLAKTEGADALTRSGDIVGTLRYMAPEQFRGMAEARSDIYALGLTLYEMLTLKPAFAAEDRAHLIEKILTDEPLRPRQLDPRIPHDLETITLKAMARDASDRYRTALELAEDLRRFLEDKPISARRPSFIDRASKWAQRHRSVVATGVIGLLAAGAILAGSAGWILRDRAARQAMTEREVDRALDEARKFQAQAKWPEALEAAKRAGGILAAGGSEDLGRRVRELRDDVNMVLRLEEIWMPHVGAGLLSATPFTVAYATAFREYGIDVEALEPSEAGARIRARKIRLELALALDSWSLFLRNRNRAPDATERRLLAVARAADSDAWRNQLRTALEQRDDKVLKELLASAPISDLPVQTLSLLVSHLLDGAPEGVERAQSLLRQAQQAHPDDFLLNTQLASFLAYDPPPHQQLDEAIRFFTAAPALRPRNAQAWYSLGEALSLRGRVDEQIACDRKAIALAPDVLPPYYALSSALEAQGNRAEAIAVLRKVADSRPNDPDGLKFPTWLLANSHFYELRDPARAVELARKAVELAPDDGSTWNTLGAALCRAGSWNAAIAALEKSMALGGGGDSFDWFFLAMAHWKLGERDKARAWYERAAQWMENEAPVDYGSYLRRFRTEAAELLGLSPGADREREHAPADAASQAELVLPADRTSTQARGDQSIGQPADAAMPNGPNAFAQP